MDPSWTPPIGNFQRPGFLRLFPQARLRFAWHSCGIFIKTQEKETKTGGGHQKTSPLLENIWKFGLLFMLIGKNLLQSKI